MAASRAFDHVVETLERETTLNRLEARGTVRLALKEAGLDAGSVSAHAMGVVVERIMPDQLRSRGIDGAEAICRRLVGSLGSLPDAETTDTPDEVFRRLGGS